MRGSSPRKISVSETAFPALWRHLEKNVKILINHLPTMSNIDLRKFDNLMTII
jgi:hypothetical protein